MNKTTFSELPEDVRSRIADINASVNILLAYLLNQTYGFMGDPKELAKLQALKIKENCDKLLED